MNKRERMECFLAREAYTDGIPAAFFQHFDASKRHGDAAMQAQLDFFHDTDMDMMKIMFDDIYPKFSVEKPEDWRRVPDFAADDPVFTQQIELAERLVKAVGKEAGVYQTIFSPFVSAGCAVSPIPVWDSVVTPHFLADPEAMTAGLTKIAKTLGCFRTEYCENRYRRILRIPAGRRIQPLFPAFFDEWFKPLDVMLLQALKDTGKRVILHICGVNMRLENYYDYPGDVVNMASVDNHIALEEARRVFGRPVMGGIPNHGVIVEGTREEVEAQVRDAMNIDTRGIMLGADCTIPKEVSRRRLRWAVDAAHAMRTGG